MPRRTPMRRACSTAAACAGGLAAFLVLAACGSRAQDAGGAAQAPARAPGDGGGPAVKSAMMPAATASAYSAQAPAMAGRTRELVNPDHSTVVFLYYDLTHSVPPIDAWVEEDPGVKYGPAAEKAGRRTALRPQLESAAVSVHDVGRLRLSMNANLSEYDPGYGEFTVRALAPSSYVEFKEYGQKIALHFINGRTAQIWKASADQAQSVRDRLGYGTADIDVLLQITGVQPAPGGGSIETRVLEYELRDARSRAVLGRVVVDPAD